MQEKSNFLALCKVYLAKSAVIRRVCLGSPSFPVGCVCSFRSLRASRGSIRMHCTYTRIRCVRYARAGCLAPLAPLRLWYRCKSSRSRCSIPFARSSFLRASRTLSRVLSVYFCSWSFLLSISIRYQSSFVSLMLIALHPCSAFAFMIERASPREEMM